MKRSLIFDTTVRLAFDLALVLSVYLLFAGHNQPGGGFVGGLVAGAGISLRYLTGDLRDVLSVIRFKPWTPLSVGLVLAAGTALSSMLAGAEPLDHRAWTFDLWVIGDVKVTSATVFDTGVYCIVVGLVLMILEAFADEVDPVTEEGIR
jgi:multisubunit Na+/H+ antiporter MnhB subunit